MLTRRELEQWATGWRMFICALVCLLTFVPAQLLAPIVAAHKTVSPAPPADRLAVFDDVWTTVGARYYDPALGGLDWPAWGASLRPLAARAQTQDELYAIMRRLVAPLHDAHTRVYAPGEYADWQRPRYLTTGISLRELAGALVVARVEPNTVAARAGVCAGDELLRVDNEAAAELFARRSAEFTGSSTARAARREALARLFDGPLETTINTVFADERGRTKTVQLKRTWAVRAPAFQVRRVGAYAVVAFNTFTPEIALQLTRALRMDLRRARGLILDLRDNGGGDAEAMTDIASAFLPAGTSLGRFTDRAGQITSEPQTRTALLLAADEIADFAGPLVVLVSARTASAAEIFSAALHEHGRARLVGEATCGCVLGVRRRHTLPDGGALDLSELDYRTADGARLEGAGLTPDETIAPTRADLRSDRDPIIMRALASLHAR
jgi:carboxyl-terminal processing protease